MGFNSGFKGLNETTVPFYTEYTYEGKGACGRYRDSLKAGRLGVRMPVGARNVSLLCVRPDGL